MCIYSNIPFTTEVRASIRNTRSPLIPQTPHASIALIESAQDYNNNNNNVGWGARLCHVVHKYRTTRAGADVYAPDR